MIVPLKYFLDQPFQNWSRETAARMGAVILLVDYRLPIEPLRQKFEEVVRASKLWDRRMLKMQVTDLKENVVEVRGMVSAATPDLLFDLRCEVRERMLDHLRTAVPQALHRLGIEFSAEQAAALGSVTGSGPGDQRVQ